MKIHCKQFFGINKQRLLQQKVVLGDVGTLSLWIGVCTFTTIISTKAYETIRNSGILTLPSSRTLWDYRHLSSTSVGLSIEADSQLLDILNQKDDLTKYCVLLFNEMYTTQGLVFENLQLPYLDSLIWEVSVINWMSFCNLLRTTVNICIGHLLRPC